MALASPSSHQLPGLMSPIHTGVLTGLMIPIHDDMLTGLMISVHAGMLTGLDPVQVTTVAVLS